MFRRPFSIHILHGENIFISRFANSDIFTADFSEVKPMISSHLSNVKVISPFFFSTVNMILWPTIARAEQLRKKNENKNE